jgi:predicted DNA-binding transcriptional regulator AlpA
MSAHVASYQRNGLGDTDEVIRLTGMSESEINNAIALSGFPRPVMVSGEVRFHRAEVVAWTALPKSSRRPTFV